MDEVTHAMNQMLNQQVTTLSEMSKKFDTLISLMKESIGLQRDIFTFFVAIDKREMGLEDTNAQEYLTELKNDGFEPKSE